MKKILILLSLLLFTGCGEKVNTCNIKTKSFEQNWKYVSKKEEIKEIELDIDYDNSNFEKIDSFETLNKEQKEVLKKQILSKLGFEKSKYDGFSIDISINKTISVKVKANILKADKEILKKIGISTDNININNVIKNMESNGAKCK